MLTLTKIDHIIKLAMIIGIGVIHIPHLTTHVIQLITPIIILVVCHVI